MAYPTKEIERFRYGSTDMVSTLRDIDPLLSVIEDHGADDTERAAFFDGEFGEGLDNPDLTWVEFVAGIQGLRDMRTAWNDNKLAIVKLVR